MNPVNPLAGNVHQLQQRLREIGKQTQRTAASRVRIGIFRDSKPYARGRRGSGANPGWVAQFHEKTEKVFFKVAMKEVEGRILRELAREMRPDFSISDQGLRRVGDILARRLRANIQAQRLIFSGRLKKSVEVRVLRGGAR